MNRNLRLLRLPWRIWRAIIIAILTIVSIEIAANALFANQLIVSIIGFILFVILFIFLYHERGAFLNVYMLYRHESEPHKGLIMLVSAPNIIPQKINNIWTLNERGVSVKLNDSIEKDIEKLEKAKSSGLRWNWQQLLRALIPHKNILKMVYIIGSPDKVGKFPQAGSFSSLDIAKELIEKYINGIKTNKFDNPIDFEDFDALVECINQCIKKLKESGIKDKDIIIDITGGLKTASIAGAMATLNTRVTFQYVDTNPDPTTGEYKIWAYDVAVQSPISI